MHHKHCSLILFMLSVVVYMDRNIIKPENVKWICSVSIMQREYPKYTQDKTLLSLKTLPLTPQFK